MGERAPSAKEAESPRIKVLYRRKRAGGGGSAFLSLVAQRRCAGISTAVHSEEAGPWKRERRQGKEGRALTLAVMGRWGEERRWRGAW